MMGNGSSIEASKVIFVEISGKHEKIVFSRHCSSRDISDLLCQAAGVSKFSQISIRDKEGGLVTISPTMPSNLPSAPYTVEIKEAKQERDIGNGYISSGGGDNDVIHQVLTQVADQFNKAFKVEDIKSDINKRLSTLEKRLEVEGLKLVEIEMCKKDITDIKNQIFDAQKKMVDYTKLSKSADRRIVMKRDVPTYPKYTLSQETIDYLKQPTFDIWHWEPNEMLSLLEHMYHELGLVQEFNINPITLKRWLLCVQENYRNNPFHNFRHCFCVTQMMYGIIHLCDLMSVITREDLGIMLTACVCHDLDHPGYNNTYQINARTDLAIRYNDISPLENHHCAIAFQIFSNPETNIFGNLDSNRFKRIRSGMIMLILATDMARHSEILEAFKSKLDNFDFNADDHLNSLKMVLIKCCDISNEVRPMTVSEPWVDCLLEEYFNQSDREKQEGLPVAPFMDRDKVTKPTAQIGFIKFVLIPMFETVAKLYVQLDDAMVKPLKAARDMYEEMKEKDDKLKKQQTENNEKAPKKAIENK